MYLRRYEYSQEHQSVSPHPWARDNNPGKQGTREEATRGGTLQKLGSDPIAEECTR